MKELTVALKVSNTILFVITAENAYPFSLVFRVNDFQSPTIAEIMRIVEEFADDDMSSYVGVGLKDPRVLEAKTIYAVLSKPKPAPFEAHYMDRDQDTLSVISNNKRDPSNGDLFFQPTEHGVVLTKEQALDFASKIIAYFNN